MTKSLKIVWNHHKHAALLWLETKSSKATRADWNVSTGQKPILPPRQWNREHIPRANLALCRPQFPRRQMSYWVCFSIIVNTPTLEVARIFHGSFHNIRKMCLLLDQSPCWKRLLALLFFRLSIPISSGNYCNISLAPLTNTEQQEI